MVRAFQEARVVLQVFIRMSCDIDIHFRHLQIQNEGFWSDYIRGLYTKWQSFELSELHQIIYSDGVQNQRNKDIGFPI